jgi:hypothetical protein
MPRLGKLDQEPQGKLEHRIRSSIRNKDIKELTQLIKECLKFFIATILVVAHSIT